MSKTIKIKKRNKMNKSNKTKKRIRKGIKKRSGICKAKTNRASRVRRMRKIPKMNKKGIEIAMNFFVMLIIIVSIFAGAVYFLQKFYKETKIIEETISKDTESQIEGLLRGGNIVAIPLNKKAMKRGQSTSFWLGILNILGEDREDFTVLVKFSKAFTDTEEIITETDPVYMDENWILVGTKPYTIKNNEVKSVGIRVNANNNIADGVSTEKGTYVFNVCVFNSQLGILDSDSCANPQPPFPDYLYTGKIYKLYVEVV